ncbi:hypothetical protein AMAG_16062 [Allomyces macrogynus ATCC 38327]|uniref:BTB domain-containing protein n=1 Tax=Allomyces macrogynus (strain ATCC 38327) TaxID=578462 RepID=A0A0L0TAB3_ALLM3|nr:hypothetical protein AMAG_16062 [Allomyces macrogynus ATCC 38327]|eukprot:KNE71758.1 hypothetical protein AMAG_16062 [Allomyces macrogynus ATCC 38327]
MSELFSNAQIVSDDGRNFKFRFEPPSSGTLSLFSSRSSNGSQPLSSSTAVKSSFGFSLFVFLAASTSPYDSTAVHDQYGRTVGRKSNLELGVCIFWGNAASMPSVLEGKNVTVSGTLGYAWSMSTGYNNGGQRIGTHSFMMDAVATRSGICAVTPLNNVASSIDNTVSSVSLEFAITLTPTDPPASCIDQTLVVPHSLGFIAFLNDPALCDCAFLTKDAPAPLYASRMMLARSSPFFRTMFSGDWAESANSKDPIKFTSWHAPAVALTFIHIYSGWLPGTPLPKGARKRVRSFACDPDTLEYPTWRNMFELAQMLELKALTLAINRQLVASLEAQFQDLKATKATYGVRDEDFESDDEVDGGLDKTLAAA